MERLKRKNLSVEDEVKGTVIGLGIIAAVTAGLLVIAVASAQSPTPTPSSGTAPNGAMYDDEFLNKVARTTASASPATS